MTYFEQWLGTDNFNEVLVNRDSVYVDKNMKEFVSATWTSPSGLVASMDRALAFNAVKEAIEELARMSDNEFQ